MDQRDLLVSSDYPWDKVVYFYQGSATASAFDWQDLVVNHNLSFTPLLIAQWSYFSDFRECYGSNDGPVDANGFPITQTSNFSDSQYIYLYYTNNSSSSTTIYWRVFGLMPSTANDDADYTFQDADSFIINSEYNYRKLFMSGRTGFSSSIGSSVTVQHDLGYRPQVIVWRDGGGSGASGVTLMTSFNGTETDGGTCAVYDDRIVMSRDAVISTNMAFHYRIYLDD